MLKNEFPSESELLEGLRRRKPVFADDPPNQSVMLRDVNLEFRTARQSRSDIGLRNHILNVFLEPRNPFEPGRMRRPKMEVTVFGTLFALIAIAVLAFNLAAPKR
jgi:hypothetical protein